VKLKRDWLALIEKRSYLATILKSSVTEQIKFKEKRTKMEKKAKPGYF
jgi:hypothetical protein